MSGFQNSGALSPKPSSHQIRPYTIPVADPWETEFVNYELRNLVANKYQSGEGFFLTSQIASTVITHFRTLSRGESVLTSNHFDDVIPSSRERKLEIWHTILSFIDFNGDGRVEIGEFFAYFIVRALRMDIPVNLPSPTSLKQIIPLSREAFQVNITVAIKEFEEYISQA
mmetsp:Transcript_28418/g.31033  ORF Transcript_28418/g.31033 Transcript_28418/m.31033 type:complete len:170 (-) Transcript_28418:216-725(-)